MNLKLLMRRLWFVLLVVILTVECWFAIPFRLQRGKGTSMLPTIPEQSVDLVLIGFFDKYHIANGTIIAYQYNSTLVILHRIIQVEANYYVCKGDNNEGPDPWPVNCSQVIALYIATLW